MDIRVTHNHYHHQINPAVEQKLDLIIKLLKLEGKIIMSDLTQLQADVATETTVEQSAITLIGGLAQQIKDAGTDPVALKAVTDQMEANQAALAAAVAANTPAAPTTDAKTA